MIFFLAISFFIFGLCWGSFLNSFAYRIAFCKPIFTKRSMCPKCGSVIFWYDNIPVFSWILLRGRCRSCGGGISSIYLLMELFTGLVFLGLFFKFLVPVLINGNLIDGSLQLGFYEVKILLTCLFFCSVVLINTATDLHAMVIAQAFSLWMMPVGVVLSYFSLTQVSLAESVFGGVIGYGVLLLTAVVFKVITKRDGVGVGDMEFLGMIGTFLGPFGVWTSLMVGSVLGLFVGLIYIYIKNESITTAKVPFGPFLSAGALMHLFFGQKLINFLF